MIGLRADRDAGGDAGRDQPRRSDRRDDRRDDSGYRSRRDDTRRRDDDRSYSRRDRSPRREPYKDQHDDRHRQDDSRSGRAREPRGGKGVEELDAEMDDLKEQVCQPYAYATSSTFMSIRNVACLLHSAHV